MVKKNQIIEKSSNETVKNAWSARQLKITIQPQEEPQQISAEDFRKANEFIKALQLQEQRKHRRK